MVADSRAASFGDWRDVELSFVWTHYVEAVERAGGAPLLFPATETLADDPLLALECVDGLVLTGGRDLHAETYCERPDPRNEPSDPRRDRSELALANAALERRVPVLGVCRGMQLLNVALGGGIEQHLVDPDGVHRGAPGTFVDHAVHAEPGTRLAGLLGEESVVVRSHHHQGVEPVAEALVVSARSPDGLVEAVELPGDGFCLAVLWHPEEDLDGGGLGVYQALVAAAREAAEVPA